MTKAANRTDREVVEAYYSDLFCNPSVDALDEKVGAIVCGDWECTPEPIGGQGATGLAETVKFFCSFAPDLHYSPKEVLQDGNKFIVRSTVTGTPTKAFLGVEPKGSFQINAVDIHEVKDGQIVKTFRIEDWARARQQITG
jgi:predicted ester cyclase